jgi:hypothetical protein
MVGVRPRTQPHPLPNRTHPPGGSKFSCRFRCVYLCLYTTSAGRRQICERVPSWPCFDEFWLLTDSTAQIWKMTTSTELDFRCWLDKIAQTCGFGVSARVCAFVFRSVFCWVVLRQKRGGGEQWRTMTESDQIMWLEKIVGKKAGGVKFV